MDVFLMIQRGKTTIFMDAKESTTVLELKKMLQGISKRVQEDIKLYNGDQPLDDHKALSDCGFTSSTARAQSPKAIGMAFRMDNGDFEALEIAPLSTPPELPDVMKPQDSASTSHAVEQVAS